MVMIPVMHSQLMQVGARELTRAPATDPGIHFQCLLAVAPLTLFPVLPGGSNRGIETMFRSAYRVQMELTSLADNKANMMISINGIIIQDIGTRTGRGDRYSAIRRIRDRAYNRLGRFKRSEERRVGKECRSRWSPYY